MERTADLIHFGRYRLVERLSAGGMGVVYRALADRTLHGSHEVALKRMHPWLSTDSKHVEMWRDEARLGALLNHPGIVRTLDFGEIAGELFMAMEFIDGFDLSTVLKSCVRRRERLPAGLVCYVVAEVAGALAYAHRLTDADGNALGIVHRDVSPSNIMLTRSGGVKLVDFGIAKVVSHLRSMQTATGTLKGKFSYMSPEQSWGSNVDRRSDLFSLGIVLYEALTLKRLFKGDNEMHTLRLVREAEVVPLSSITSVDVELDAVVMRLLARAPEDRFATGEEAVAALTPIAARLGGDATRLSQFLRGLKPSRARPVAVEQRPEVATQLLGPSVAPTRQTASGGLAGVVVAPAARARGRWPRRLVVGAAVLVAALLALWRAAPGPMRRTIQPAAVEVERAPPALPATNSATPPARELTAPVSAAVAAAPSSPLLAPSPHASGHRHGAQRHDRQGARARVRSEHASAPPSPLPHRDNAEIPDPFAE